MTWNDLFSLHGITTLIFWPVAAYLTLMLIEWKRLNKGCTARQKRNGGIYAGVLAAIALTSGLINLFWS